MSSNGIDSILTRGVAQVLPSAKTLTELMQKRKIRLYLGIDPTGAFLTLGHAVVLKKLQQFADAGHDVILLIGNGTVRIGDPTGRDSTRPVLTDEEIRKNFQDWKSQAEKILDFSKITIKYNGDWLEKLNYIDMVKLLGNVTIQQLLERDMFQERIKKGQPIFGHEIIYPLLQGYDSVAMEVDLELGGTDQTFNMLMGRTLLKNYKKREKWILSVPIINGTDGRKMSKSYGNFIALTDEANEIFGKIMSTKDEEMMMYFEIFTEIDLEEAKNLILENPRNAKVKLAKAIVSWLHNEKSADEAERDFVQKFVKKEVPDQMPDFLVEEDEIGILTLISKICKFANSNSEARQLIAGNAVSIDGENITDPKYIVKISGEMVLKVGKRKFGRIKK
ncbi:tyrosine--tRNA ligase [Candidatus Gracilibacteria bacterium]|nr:tyrosine--tRNA ligase [Candidatus Gracilibacteria bacterium]